MMKKSLLSAAVVFGLASTSYAQGSLSQAFLNADSLYSQRDQGTDGGLANTLAARKAYQAIVDSGAKNADLVRAVEGLARTYYFQGEVLVGKTTDAEKKARKAIFNDCWNKVIEPISPAKLGSSSAVYYYFRATCLAHEAEVSSPLERLLSLPKLLDTFTQGANAPGSDTFEGGGLARVKAAVKGNIEAKGLPGGLYNPEESLTLIESSIASQGDILGELFCENFYRKATTLSLIDGRKAEAKALAVQTAADFTDYLAAGDLIPEKIRAETQHCVEEVTAFGAAL